jgi:carbamoyltransferase
VNILGITYYVHDSAACLIKGGSVIANIEEERFNRIKHTGVFSRQAIEYVLKAGNLTIDDIDIIAFNWYPLKALVSECLKFLLISPPVYFKMLRYNITIVYAEGLLTHDEAMSFLALVRVLLAEENITH